MAQTDSKRSEQREKDRVSHQESWAWWQAKVGTSRGIDFNNCWNLMHHLDELGQYDGDLDKYFGDINKNPSKAILLLYLNSGYGRFDLHKEFDQNYVGEDVDIDRINKEIKEEVLDEEELYKLLEHFFMEHSFMDNQFFSCSACGIREMRPGNEKCADNKKLQMMPLSDLSFMTS